MDRSCDLNTMVLAVLGLKDEVFGNRLFSDSGDDSSFVSWKNGVGFLDTNSSDPINLFGSEERDRNWYIEIAKLESLLVEVDASAMGLEKVVADDDSGGKVVDEEKFDRCLSCHAALGSE